MEKTYLFYDIETSGLNPCFDQVVQFAAIRTDLKFNEMERYEYWLRFNPDVMASPDALITHQIHLKDLQQGDSELHAMQKIHQLFNTEGTISLGYNSLSFDDEFLRFSFYRNLLHPYTHQYAHNCQRMDIYPIIILYYLYASDVLIWPNQNSRPSMKLELINQANQLAQGVCHNAMVDVEVTLALAKKLSKNARMWSFIQGYFHKHTDIGRLKALGEGMQIAVYGTLGSECQYQSLSLPIGQHWHYTNQLLWLRLDDKDFSTLTEDERIKSTRCLKKRAGEPPIILPCYSRYLNKIHPEKIALAQKNRQWLEENPKLAKGMIDYHKDYTYPKIAHVDIDAQLYQTDFPSYHDAQCFTQFHQVNDPIKPNILSQFDKPLYRQLGERVLARHIPYVLSQQQQKDFEQYIQHIFSCTEENARLDYRNQRQLTKEQCIQLIETIRKEKTLNECQQHILDTYQNRLHLL